VLRTGTKGLQPRGLLRGHVEAPLVPVPFSTGDALERSELRPLLVCHANDIVVAVVIKVGVVVVEEVDDARGLGPLGAHGFLRLRELRPRLSEPDIGRMDVGTRSPTEVGDGTPRETLARPPTRQASASPPPPPPSCPLNRGRRARSCERRLLHLECNKRVEMLSLQIFRIACESHGGEAPPGAFMVGHGL
jgi:hypothetical protein